MCTAAACAASAPALHVRPPAAPALSQPRVGAPAAHLRWRSCAQIWVADPRYKGRSMTLVRPKSGIPYTVWPVMHSYLTKKGLKSVDQQQARAALQSY